MARGAEPSGRCSSQLPAQETDFKHFHPSHTDLSVYTWPLYSPPHLAIRYCSYAGCLLLEMNNCCHHGLSTEHVSVSWL